MPATPFALTSHDGLNLFAQHWLAEQPRAVVAVIHGLGEHSTRYAHVAAHLNANGYAVSAFDLRGHGQSGGQPRAYTPSFEHYRQDVDVWLARVRADFPTLPVFLMGHSMGAAIAVTYVLTRPTALAGLIASSGALQPGKDVSPLLIAVGKVLARLAPTLPTLNIEPRWLTRDPAMLKRALADPLNHYGGTPARTGAELLAAMQLIRDRAHELTLPLWVFHGTADTLTDPAGSERLHARAGSADKTLTLYPGSYHETLNDLDRAQVLRDLTTWLNAHVP